MNERHVRMFRTHHIMVHNAMHVAYRETEKIVAVNEKNADDK